MAQRSVYVRPKKKKKKPSMLLPVLVLFLLSLLIALGVAALWQMLEDRQEQRENESSSSSSSSLPPESSSGTPDSPENAAAAPDDTGPDQSSESGTSSESGQAEGQEPAGGSGEPEESSSSEPESTGQAEYGKPVPKSDPVGTDYFDDALFLGDSITQGIESYGLMSNATVIANKGINPTTFLESAVVPTANGNITMLEAAALEHPAKIYILLGTNGISWIRESLFIEYYSAIIDQLKKDHPDSIIYVQSIFPVTKEKSEQDPQLSNSKIDEYNAAILEMTKEKQVYYLNVAEGIKDENGALPTEASPKDGIHFGTPTYEKWFDYLQNHTVSKE